MNLKDMNVAEAIQAVRESKSERAELILLAEKEQFSHIPFIVSNILL